MKGLAKFSVLFIQENSFISGVLQYSFTLCLFLWLLPQLPSTQGFLQYFPISKESSSLQTGVCTERIVGEALKDHI